MEAVKTILNKHRSYDNNKTHTCIEHPFNGSFIFNRESMGKVFDILSENHGMVLGLCEMPQYYSMLRFDIDIQKEFTGKKEKLYTKDDQLTLVKDIQTILKKNIQGYDPKHSHCIVLTKEPYTKKSGEKIILKHGYHLQFINCFVSKSDFQYVEAELSKKHNIDKISSNPWLMYGCCKDKDSGTYKAAYYVDSQGIDHSITIEVVNTEIYDEKEEIIRFKSDKHLLELLPRILSIIPFGRKKVEFKERKSTSVSKTSVKPRRELINTQSSEIYNTYKDDIIEIIQEYLDDNNMTDLAINDDREVDAGYIKLTGGFTCPISGEEHDRRGAYVMINENGLYFGCYKCMSAEGRKTVRICRLRDIDTEGLFANKSEQEHKRLIKSSRAKNNKAMKDKKDFIVKNTKYDKFDLDMQRKDAGLANIFYNEYAKENIITTDEKGNGYRWLVKKRVWKQSESVFLENICMRELEKSINKYTELILEEMKENGESEETIEKKKNMYKKVLDYVLSRKNTKNIFKSLLSSTHNDEFEGLKNQTAHLLPIKGGKVIDLKTKEVRERTREDLFTFELDVDYCRGCDYSKVIDFFSGLSCGNKDLLRYFQLFLGYCLTGEVDERSLFVFFGTGLNGKSTLTNIMKKILGPFFTSCSESVLLNQERRSGATPELVCLQSARLAVLAETDKEEKLNAKRVKNLTGGDIIYARDLYQKTGINFKPKAKYVMMTNHRPSFDISDQAMIDRVKQIPFLARFDRNPDYEKDLLDNHLDSLFSWIVDGAFDWYNGEKLVICDVMKKEMDKWITDLDTVQQFIDEQCKEDSNGFISSEAIYSEFAGFCCSSSEKLMSKKEFIDRLKKKGYEYKKKQVNNKRCHGFVGLCIN